MMEEKQRLLFKEELMGFEVDGAPYLAASRCKKCGKVFFTAREFCTQCYAEEMESVKLTDAQLHVHTVVHIGVKGFDTPYILAWVTFPEGVRIVAQVDFPAGQADELRPGQSLKVVCGRLRTLEDGTEIMGYKFKPVF